MAKVFFLNSKTLGRFMAGPGIRIWELARALSDENQVTISVPKVSALNEEKIKVVARFPFGLFRELITTDIVIAPIYSLDLVWLWLASLLRKRIVIDAYFIPLFENIEKYAERPKLRQLVVKISNFRTKCLLLMADLILCASQRQRDYWREQLDSFGRRAARIELVPTGVKAGRPVKQHDLIKGVVPGIKKDDRVVLWASGLWPWLDPATAIRAMTLIEDERIKLVFFGTGALDEHFRGEANAPLEKASELAKHLNLYNRRVFFRAQRVPYDEIADYLLEADAAVNLHHDHPETHYAYRTRLLDYIWAGLPVVTTRGDVISEAISREKMGVVVDYGADRQVADAILKLLREQEFSVQCRENMRRQAAGITWAKVSSPLRDYCREVPR